MNLYTKFTASSRAVEISRAPSYWTSSPLVSQLSLFAAVNLQSALSHILELLLLIFSQLGNWKNFNFVCLKQKSV